MKLDYFATLDAVLRTGSLTAASKERHLTPSAVSMQMKQLEAYFGSPLFDRSRRRPTGLAEAIISRLQPALEEIERMRRLDDVTVRGELTMGVIDALQPSLMPRVLTMARSRYPTLKLNVQRGRTRHLLSELKAGTLDAAIVARCDGDGPQRLVWSPLFQAPLVMIAPPQSVQTDRQALFDRYEWIRFDRSSVTGRVAAEYVRSAGLRTHGDVELESAPSVFGMVNAGLGVSLVAVSDPRVCLGYPVRTLHLGSDAPSLQFSLVTRAPDAGKRALNALLAVCEEAARHLHGPSAESLASAPAVTGAEPVARRRKRERPTGDG